MTNNAIKRDAYRMMDLQIKLVDNLKACYYAGETLQGIVKLRTKEPLKVLGLSISFQGNGYCDWRDDNIMQNVNSPGCSSAIYKGREGYLNATVNLIGSPNGDLIDIPAGCTDIPFKFTLTPSLPSSFNGRFGHIFYNMEAVLNLTELSSQKVLCPFFVQNLFNLNVEPQLKFPIESEMIKEFMSLCCKKSRFYLSADIPYSGYTSAQSIKVCIKLTNESSVTIERTTISIRKIVSYNVKEVCKEDIETIVTNNVEGVEPNQSKNIEHNLKVPETITNIKQRNSTIIQVDYDLIVSCIPIGCHFSPKLKIPIKIGNIPLEFDTIKTSPKDFTIVPEVYPDIAPPTYHEAFNIVHNKLNSMEM